MEESNIHVIISEMKRERKQYRLRTEPNTNCMGSTELYVFIGMLPLGPSAPFELDARRRSI